MLWQLCRGITGSLRMESVATFVWNTHIRLMWCASVVRTRPEASFANVASFRCRVEMILRFDVFIIYPHESCQHRSAASLPWVLWSAFSSLHVTKSSQHGVRPVSAPADTLSWHTALTCPAWLVLFLLPLLDCV